MKYTLWGLILGMHTVLHAQQSTDSLQIKQVEVVKAFEASIATVSKVDIKPQEAITERTLPSYTYTMTHQPIAVSDPVPVIKPLAMETDPPFKIHNGYLQASYGYRQNPEIEAGYHVMQKEAFNAGVRVHYASLDNSSRQPWQKFRTMGATLYGQKLISENIQLFGDVQSDFQRRYFYHTSVISDTLQNNSLERQRNDLGFKLGIRNAEETKTGIHYESGIGIKRLTLVHENVSEWSFSVSAKMYKNFSDKFQFKTHAQIDNAYLKTQTNLSQSIVQITPAIKVNFSKLSTEVGVQYLSTGTGDSYIFPVGAIHVPIKDPNLVIIGEVSQGNYANTMRNASVINPFIQSTVDSLVNTVSRNISLGVKGTTSSLAYRIKLGRQTLEDQMFFVNQPNDVRKFKMIYDSGVQWYVIGAFEKNFAEQFLLGSQITLNRYKLDNLPHAWHIPNFEGSFYVKTSLFSEKLGLRGDFVYNSFSYYPDEENGIRQTNALMDVSLSGIYKLDNKITVTASIQNMLNNRFERWYGYPTIGINPSIGIKVLF